MLAEENKNSGRSPLDGKFAHFKHTYSGLHMYLDLEHVITATHTLSYWINWCLSEHAV